MLARGHDAGIVVEDEGLGHTTETLEAARQGGTQVTDGAAQGEDRGMGARPGQRGHEAEGFPADAPSHRHGCAGVPPVDLADLAGQVRRALVRAGRQEARADPGEVLLPGS
jgi:hypothetical protein